MKSAIAARPDTLMIVRSRSADDSELIRQRLASMVLLTASQTVKVLAPWAALLVLLFATGVGIVLRPMRMRVTLSAVG